MPHATPPNAAAVRLQLSDALNSDDPELARRLVLSPRSFRRLADYIVAELGIKTPPAKSAMIQSRLLGRVRHLGLASLDEYCEHLFSPAGQAEVPHFIDAVTTNKTDFFREPEHFEILRTHALPALAPERGRAGPPRVNVWSAACSTGNEPYTLAMVLAEHALAFPGFDFSILATDISGRVLETARQAVYPCEQIVPVPRDLRWRYLQRGRSPETGCFVRVNTELRERVRFERLNLMQSEYGVPRDFDVVFCRNVLIYFDRPTQQAVIARLCRHLKPGGFLFVGHSESLSGLDLPLEQVRAAVYRRLPGQAYAGGAA